LEIALAFGKDIDDRARVPEMAAVVAATGLGSATPFLFRSFGLTPIYSIPFGALSTAAVTQLIGRSAIAFYQRQPREQSVADASVAVPASATVA